MKKKKRKRREKDVTDAEYIIANVRKLKRTKG